MDESAAGLGCVVKAIAVLMVAVVIGARATLVHKTIQSDDGDVIDCVDMYHQPALKHAPLGSRVIQANPERSMKAIAAAVSAPNPLEWHQSWRKRGSCPAGSVPILRNSSRANPEAAEMARRASPFGRPAIIGGNASFDVLTSMDTSKGKVEVAAAYATNGPYLGARAEVPYWKVNVHPDEFSMNYILVGSTLDPKYKAFRGAEPPAHLTNQIAVGLVAWPAIYGDSVSRLFVYYTNDEGVVNNCFNLDCGGFHLVDKTPTALGAQFGNKDSQVGGDIYGIAVGIHRDPAGGRWWVSVLDQDIGYYPETLFNERFGAGHYVEMGGRVFDSRPGGVHTTTTMGSGMPACGGWGVAASIAAYHGVSNDGGVLFNDDASRTLVTKPGCYGASPLGFDKERGGFNVLYGGPGGIYCDHSA